MEKIINKGGKVVNRVFLIGNLGADPEIRYTQSGTPVATFNMATTRRWKDKDGQQQEETEWHRLVAWSRLAEICGEYFNKGSKVYIEGRLQTRKWQDQGGSDRWTTEVVAEAIQILSPRKGDNSGASQTPLPQGGGGNNNVPF